jgi:hypothetical protein
LGSSQPPNPFWHLDRRHPDPQRQVCCWREPAAGEEEDDPEDWIDEALSSGLWVSTWLDVSPSSTLVLEAAEAPPYDESTFADPVELPASDKAHKAEENLARTEQYLRSLRLPSYLNDKTSAQLLRSAARLFLLNDRLWQRQNDGQHQLYIPLHQRLPLVRNAHDNVGHKGFYYSA